jgi:hypothetical protein
MDETRPCSEDAVLAALARAETHAGAEPIPFWTLLEHLGVAPRTRPARRARAALDALAERGWVEHARRHGVPVFACTTAGRRRLARLRRRRALPELPESPQHQRWRLARERAERELDGFRAELATCLLEAQELLVADDVPAGGSAQLASDAWFALGSRLLGACRRVGAAVHVLWEWQEPTDERADVDDLDAPGDAALDEETRARRRAARAGRRNTRLWQ